MKVTVKGRVVGVSPLEHVGDKGYPVVRVLIDENEEGAKYRSEQVVTFFGNRAPLADGVAAGDALTVECYLNWRRYGAAQRMHASLDANQVLMLERGGAATAAAPHRPAGAAVAAGAPSSAVADDAPFPF